MFGIMGNNGNNEKRSAKGGNDTKWGFAFVTLYNWNAIEKKVQEMAAKGWLIEEMQNSFIWNYRRIEPRELSFALVYSELTWENDADSIEKQRERDELYAADGWVAAADWDTLRIYYNEQPDPVPIETEPLVQVEGIYRAMMRQWRYYAFLAIAFAFQLAGHIFSRVSGSLANDFLSFIDLILLDFYMLFFPLAKLFSDLRWHKKALAAAEQGFLLPINRSKIPFRVFCIFLILIVLFLLL